VTVPAASRRQFLEVRRYFFFAFFFFAAFFAVFFAFFAFLAMLPSVSVRWLVSVVHPAIRDALQFEYTNEIKKPLLLLRKC
jgi:hypothetical protein